VLDVVAPRGEDDDRDVARLAQLLGHGEAVHLRHHDVQDDEVRPDRAGLLEGLGAVVRSLYAVALFV